MKVQIFVRLKPGVLDVQGKAVEQGLLGLGFDGVAQVRVGKLIEFNIKAPTFDQAKQQAEKMCEKLLANTIIESYEIKPG